MANIKSSKKSIRKIAKRTLRNKAEKSRIKTASKKLEALKESGDAEAIKAAAKTLMSVVDKAGKHGVWHENKVNRIKGRLTPLIFGAVLKKSEGAAKTAEGVSPVVDHAETTEAVEEKEVLEAEAKKSVAKTTVKEKTVAKKPAAKKASTKKAVATKAKKSSSKKSE
jgi:small subunit ribosomal protein S20